MKWKNEMPNKTEFMKVNTFNFLENEKYDCGLVHAKNAAIIQETSQQKESSKSHGNFTATSPDNDKEKAERRIMTEETITLTKSRTDFSGSTPKRYTTKCFIKPTPVPVWYTESLLLKIGSTKKTYKEQVYFKNKMLPFQWSENMETEVKTGPKCILSEIDVPIDDSDEFHYISLEPQQDAAKITNL